MGGYVSVHFLGSFAIFCTLLHNTYIHLWNSFSIYTDTFKYRIYHINYKPCHYVSTLYSYST